jgi:DNA processing protein
MKAKCGPREALTACRSCLRRAWLLARLAPSFDRALGGAPGTHIHDLLGLSDADLADAVAPLEATLLISETYAQSEEALQEQLAAAGSWAICCHDPLYPAGLRSCPTAPPALVGKGDPGLLPVLARANVVTIVGSRRATSYGRGVARELGRDLAEAGIAVASGMAFGIDSSAQRGALEAGRTVAVLGCGADIAYPASHRPLWRKIVETGLVLSELAPGTPPHRWTFRARNRILAALGGVTVVVEAAEHSGSMSTARRALAIGRPVGAVPGPANSCLSAGPNQLLAEGARLIRSAQDVLDLPEVQAIEPKGVGDERSIVPKPPLDG